MLLNLSNLKINSVTAGGHVFLLWKYVAGALFSFTLADSWGYCLMQVSKQGRCIPWDSGASSDTNYMIITYCCNAVVIKCSFRIDSTPSCLDCFFFLFMQFMIYDVEVTSLSWNQFFLHTGLLYLALPVRVLKASGDCRAHSQCSPYNDLMWSHLHHTFIKSNNPPRTSPHKHLTRVCLPFQTNIIQLKQSLCHFCWTLV